MIPKGILEKLDPDAADFLQRMFSGRLDRYDHRLECIDFTGMNRVLDAGCGFGQWTQALARHNTEAHGIDVDSSRLLIAEQLSRDLGIKNTRFRLGSLVEIGYPDRYFDAIFCYGAIFYADEDKVTKEFGRLLKPGGKLYFTFNAIGTYLYFFIQKGLMERRLFYLKDASMAFLNSLLHRKTGGHIIAANQIRRLLLKNGFKDIQVGKDGQMRLKAPRGSKSFFRPSYLGFNTLLEVLSCRK